MTSISNNSPLASYFANSSKPSTASTAGGAATASDKPSAPPADPLAEIRRFADNLVANSRGGLLRAIQGGGNPASSALASDRLRPAAEQDSAKSKIALPDVAKLDRDDAAKLLAQVNKLVDAGLDKLDNFVGYNGEQQTHSLTTYRDWLQAKGGVSIYV
ncbi:hypothetical protein DBR00_01560 [Pseudomonas sp. HMWF032]|uniref:hypothetical protein n=1 Tax=unclassified Pseudomonas TaxID=196821 RepID=UPI000D3D9D6C|nr:MULTISPECIES: hypothetical protein [unclassified Pseudomonas]PTS86759.1 hypothetical protein DBR00_01560 [Pseudomonas sp. HMWF032]PTT79430.1 hypothetical protein DBR41_21595 [Pseudomonas sp. HMWF010]WAC43473.1 hypothetical protein OU997_14485 [Pseudomonas sp. SL4(2022)]